jgi:hypothetical protein
LSKKVLKRKIEALEKQFPKGETRGLPSGVLMVKGFWFHSDPEVCRTLPEPDGVGIKIGIFGYDPRAGIKVWNSSNYHLLPCYTCRHFLKACSGYQSLKFDLESIRAGLA